MYKTYLPRELEITELQYVTLMGVGELFISAKNSCKIYSAYIYFNSYHIIIFHVMHNFKIKDPQRGLATLPIKLWS